MAINALTIQNTGASQHLPKPLRQGGAAEARQTERSPTRYQTAITSPTTQQAERPTINYITDRSKDRTPNMPLRGTALPLMREAEPRRRQNTHQHDHTLELTPTTRPMPSPGSYTIDDRDHGGLLSTSRTVATHRPARRAKHRPPGEADRVRPYAAATALDPRLARTPRPTSPLPRQIGRFAILAAVSPEKRVENDGSRGAYDHEHARTLPRHGAGPRPTIIGPLAAAGHAAVQAHARPTRAARLAPAMLAEQNTRDAGRQPANGDGSATRKRERGAHARPAQC